MSESFPATAAAATAASVTRADAAKGQKTVKSVTAPGGAPVKGGTAGKADKPGKVSAGEKAVANEKTPAPGAAASNGSAPPAAKDNAKGRRGGAPVGKTSAKSKVVSRQPSVLASRTHWWLRQATYLPRRTCAFACLLLQAEGFRHLPISVQDRDSVDAPPVRIDDNAVPADSPCRRPLMV